MSKTCNVLVKATGELLSVHPLKNGNFYDAENWKACDPPKATQAGKKEFTPEEVQVLSTAE